jgi:hypothetical protein
MKESGLFVDNPLELTELFGGGVFLVPEMQERNFVYHGAGNLKILNVLYYDQRDIPPKALEVLSKLMFAVKFSGKNLEATDYSVINAASVLSENRLEDIIADFQPQKLIVWSDDWFGPLPAPTFYQETQLSGISVLRCHALQTVVTDEERKRECWSSIKRYFGF